MESKTARAILSEVAAGGWLDREIPEEEKDLIDLADYFVEEARLALGDGMDNEHINAIINLAKASPPVLSDAAVHNHDGAPPGEINDWDEGKEQVGGAYFVPKEVADTYPRRSSGGFSESDLRDYEGLPIPQAVESAYAQDMPTDLTELGDKAVRRAYSAFGSYLNRARWRLAIANSNLANANHLKDEAYRTEYIRVKREAITNEEKLTIEDLQNLAKDSDQYKEWSKRVADHSAEATNWKALVEIYGGNVDRLSREWTMRTEQYERER
jgi:flagellar basal body rod protein FlgC